MATSSSPSGRSPKLLGASRTDNLPDRKVRRKLFRRARRAGRQTVLPILQASALCSKQAGRGGACSCGLSPIHGRHVRARPDPVAKTTRASRGLVSRLRRGPKPSPASLPELTRRVLARSLRHAHATFGGPFPATSAFVDGAWRGSVAFWRKRDTEYSDVLGRRLRYGRPWLPARWPSMTGQLARERRVDP